jgi:hypothetical protein
MKNIIIKGGLGVIGSGIQGTRGYLSQTSSNALINRNHLNSIKEKNFKNKSLFELCSNILNIKHERKYQIISKENSLISPILKVLISDEDKALFLNCMNLTFKDCYFFVSSRCQINSFTFHSTSYLLRQSSDSYTVSYTAGDKGKYGEITKFCEYDQVKYAFINTFKELEDYSLFFEDN